MKAVRIVMAAATRKGRGSITNEDAVGANGWALWATEPAANTLPSPADLVVDLPPGGRATFVVADGLGGLLGAQQASLLVAETLSGPDIGDWQSLSAALNRAHQRLQAIQRARPEVGEMGAAVAGVTVDASGTSVCFNLGDVRVYFANAGTLVQGTRDDAERLPFATRPRLTRWVGQAGVDRLEPYVRRLDAAQERRMLVCSDGLHAASPGDEVLERILCDPAPVSARVLVERLLDAVEDPPDDATALVVQVFVT